jgi:hypothetical protein
MLNMTEQKRQKINQLQHLLPSGLLASARWLNEHDYPSNLLAHYVARGWLESPARGVYRRPGPPLTWQHVVASLQVVMGLPVHAGGRTALVHRGLAHYLRLGGAEPIRLYGASRLPSWVNRLGLPQAFSAKPDTLFELPRVQVPPFHAPVAEDSAAAQGRLGDVGLSRFSWETWPWDLLYSSEERAILEVLDDVPKHETVYDADALLQGLVNLRPVRLMKLLKACRSVKVKRLFLALAERHRHAWLDRLAIDELDLGAGKRSLVAGGRLHPKYRITLPADLDGHLQ